MNRRQTHKDDIVPKRIRKDFLVSEIYVFNRTVATVSPKQKASTKHLIYFHGGAYVMVGLPMHWHMLRKLIKNSGFTISYVDYPLAPHSDFRNTIAMVEQSLKKLYVKYQGDEFILMGDSAGGGLALALMQKLRDDKIPYKPQKAVLFSPWLDVTMSHPEIAELEELDILLSLESLNNAARSYAQGADLNHPLLSPINGQLDDLGAIALFVGTHEMFLPDSRKFSALIEKSNTEFRYFEYAEMVHDWILFPIPEADQAIQDAIEFINT